MLALYLTIVFLCLLTLYIVLEYNESRRLINKIPGPTPLPFLGNVLMFNVALEQLWKIAIQLLDDYYPIARLVGGPLNVVVIRHPDDMKALLSCKKNIDKSNLGYNTIRGMGNDGLVVSGGDKWRQRRKFLNPAFNPHLLKVYVEVVNEETERWVKQIKNDNDEITLDLLNTFGKLTLGILCKAAMGIDANDFTVMNEEEFRHGYNEIGQIVLSRLARPYLRDWMMKFSSAGRRQHRVIKQSRQFVNDVIQIRRGCHEKFGYRNFQSIVNDLDDEISINQRKRLSVLDLLLAAEKENLIDEQGVREETEIMLIAGYETGSTAMTFALMHLAENKAVQQMARNEVTEMLMRSGGVLATADLLKMHYLERCIKETLRLFPSGPFIGRMIKEKITLSNYEIPIHTQVFANIYSLHRDPNFWPEPEKYDPDRFLPENTAARHPFAYVPFSAGLRSCIGSKFAMLEMKAIIALVLYNFYLEPVDLTTDVIFKLHVTLHPSSKCRIKLQKINRESST